MSTIHRRFTRLVSPAVCFLALLASLFAGPLADESRAGSFTVRTCHGSSNQPVATTDGTLGWHWGTIGSWPGYGPDPVNRCWQTDSGAGATDNAMSALNDQTVARPVNSGIGWEYTAAPNTSITAYRLWLVGAGLGTTNGVNGAVLAYATPFNGFDRAIDGGAGGGGSTDWTDSPWADVSGKSAGAVQVWAVCGGVQGGSCPGGSPGYGNSWFNLYKAQMTTSDNSSPASSAAAGDAIEHGTWHGSQSLAFNASDTGAGVYRLVVQSGPDAASLAARSTHVIDDNDGRCQDENPANADPFEFTSPRPCSLSVSSDEEVDTTRLPDGAQVVRVQVEDAAGNRTTVYGPATKTVDNLPPVISAVTVDGPVAREGETLTCTAAVDGQSPATTFRWLRSNADGSDATVIPGASSASYVLTANDLGHKVQCTVTATDGGGQASATSGLTDGPFGSGHTVVAYCSGRPTGARDECGDLDGDGVMNRLDPDIDGDGAGNATDPDPWDPVVRPGVLGPDSGAEGHNGVTGRPGDAGPQGAEGPAASIKETAKVDLNVVPVPNPTSGSGLNGSPADDEAVLAAYFERGTGKRRVVSGVATAGVRERLRIRGTLKTHDGKPIVGAKVFLAQRKADGAWKVDGGTVSRQDGSLLLFTRKGGFGRQLRLVYFPRDGRDANRGSATLGLRIRQGARLTLSRTRLHNRDRLRFLGAVDGSIARRGPLVQIQVKLPAGWSTFSSTRATKARHGRFSVSYRFRRTTRRTVYRFRVRVVPAASTGYVGGTSKVRKVVVLP